LSENVEFEREELAEIYIKRGVDQNLARQVAEQLMAKDALTAHARDELGISEITTARPVQAALTSAATFAVGAAMPLLMVVVSPASALVPIVSGASLGFLALLGAIGAGAGGANVLRATARVTFWGAMAMALTAIIGKLFGTVELKIGVTRPIQEQDSTMDMATCILLLSEEARVGASPMHEGLILRQDPRPNCPSEARWTR
jgi:VIT1/CCC1 family predicted Fe2+/Mn2+ transporter